jgi:hypothetical protein
VLGRVGPQHHLLPLLEHAHDVGALEADIGIDEQQMGQVALCMKLATATLRCWCSRAVPLT